MSPIKTVTTRKTKIATQGELRPLGPETALQVDLSSTTVSTQPSLESRQELEIPSSAIAMVTDLIGVVGGEVRSSSPTCIQADFKNTLHAVKAVRHLESLLRGFARSSEAIPISARFTLTSVGELVFIASESASTAVEQTQSAQVIFKGNICREARSIPGLQFKEIPRFGAGLGDFQVPSLELLPPSHMPVLVAEPIQAHSPPEFATTQASPAADPRGASNSKVNAGPILVRKTATIPVLDKVKSLTERLIERRGALPSWLIPVGGAGAGLAVILGLVLFLKPSATSKRQASQDHTRSRTASPAPTTPVVSIPVSPIDTTGKKASNSLPKVEKIPGQQRSLDSNKGSKTQQKEEDISAKSTRASGNLSSAEINMTISEADKLAGDGQYDKAIELYNVVLKHDPQNFSAKQGKSRAEHNKMR